MQEVGCGVVIPPGRPELARRRRSASCTRGEHDLEEMGRRGRAYVDGGGRPERRVRALPRAARRGHRRAPRGATRSIVGRDRRRGALLARARRARLDARRATRASRSLLARAAAAAAPGRRRRLPTVTVIVAAHDEEPVIERRIENLLALDYPARAARDRRHLRRLDRRAPRSSPRRAGARVIRNPRGGKVAAQDRAVRETEGEIVAFSDANATWAPDALRRLVAPVRRPGRRLRLRPAAARARRRLEQGGRLLALRAGGARRPSRGSARSPAATARSTRCAARTTSRSTRASGTTSRCRT